MIKNIAIIGSKGKMAKFLERKFYHLNINIFCVDQEIDDYWIKTNIPSVDCVLLAIPVTAFENIIPRLVPYLLKGTILTDICSVKVYPMQYMQRYYQGPIVGTHPLFGPKPVENETNIAICPTKGFEIATQEIITVYTQCGFTPFLTNADEHDKAMAYFQGLNFITTLAYLASTPNNLDLNKYITPSFERRLLAAKKLIISDGPLFTTLVDHNPFSAESARYFRAFLSIAASGDLDLLREKSMVWWEENK